MKELVTEIDMPLLMFVRVHWVKQRHTRTVLRDGHPQQEVVSERIWMQQHGDTPPPELQDKLDSLADYFRNYDIKPPSSPCDDSPD